MHSFNWSILLGGFTFFFFGLKHAHRGLEALAGERLRAILGRLTTNRFMAVLFGALVTVMLQSSGATSVMLVSFAQTRLLTLSQAIAVLLGSDIGTTLTVFLLSIKKVTEYALLILTVGFLFQLSSSRRMKYAGDVLLGFGFIFYGMHLMSEAAIPLRENPYAGQALSFLAGSPVATLLLATILSSALHSAGTIGIALALAHCGAITFDAALPVVLGANVGSCITAVLSSLGTSVEGKRVAAAHTFSKIAGVALVFPFLPDAVQFINAICEPVGRFIPIFEPGVPGRIVIAHILFNLALALVFLPLIRVLVLILTTFIPEPEEREEPFGPKYLTTAALQTPALAFAQVKREILRLGGIAAEQLGRGLRMFSKGLHAEEEMEKLIREDDKIDTMEKAIRFYLAKLSVSNLTEKEAARQLALMAIAQDFEEIGDTLSKEMVSLAKKKTARHGIFSDEGWEDLRRLQSLVSENMELALSILAQPSGELVTTVLRHETKMEEIEQGLRQSHLARLNQGLKESLDTSSIHLDILSSLRRINGKVTHVVRRAGEL